MSNFNIGERVEIIANGLDVSLHSEYFVGQTGTVTDPGYDDIKTVFVAIDGFDYSKYDSYFDTNAGDHCVLQENVKKV